MAKNGTYDKRFAVIMVSSIKPSVAQPPYRCPSPPPPFPHAFDVQVCRWNRSEELRSSLVALWPAKPLQGEEQASKQGKNWLQTRFWQACRAVPLAKVSVANQQTALKALGSTLDLEGQKVDKKIHLRKQGGSVYNYVRVV